MAKKSDKSAKPSKRRGPKSHFDDAKTDFLKQYVTDWEEARNRKTPTLFYNTVTTAFIIRFGYDMTLNEDADGSPVPESELLEPVDGEKVPGTAGLTKEEAAVKINYYTRLRTVRCIFLSMNDTHKRFLRNCRPGSIITVGSSAATPFSKKLDVCSRQLRRTTT